MVISKATIQAFRDDLCKDQREIKIISDPTNLSKSGLIVRKYSTSIEEFKNEIDVMTYLLNDGLSNIPSIIGYGSDSIGSYLDIEYYNGIRVFNLLAYIRELQREHPEYSVLLSEFRDEILSKCLHNQINIQKSLLKWSYTSPNKEPYPQNKLFIIINMLSELYGFELDQKRIKNELVYIADEFERISVVPFRDSTTKNMVIYYPDLYLGNYVDSDEDALSADEHRKTVFFRMVQDGSYKNILSSPIIDFDFSSCENLTSVYDDPIGFSCHEITFNGIPNENKLVWLEDQSINSKDIALSFIIRYLRFGGRKMTYHIIHPHAYKYRFKYDNEFFYFNHLDQIIQHFWPDSHSAIPEFLKLIQKVKKPSNVDLFDDVDEFEIQYPNCNRKFYLDIFPY